jgi:hypothetical protein
MPTHLSWFPTPATSNGAGRFTDTPLFCLLRLKGLCGQESLDPFRYEEREHYAGPVYKARVWQSANYIAGSRFVAVRVGVLKARTFNDLGIAGIVVES